MNDSTRNVDTDVIELDDLTEESAELLEESIEDFSNFVDEFDDVESTEPIQSTETTKNPERFWLALIIVAFTLALLMSIVLLPIVSNQKQRIEESDDIINAVKLMNGSAAQALTSSGTFEPVGRNLTNIENSINSFVSSDSPLVNMAGLLFGNQMFNEKMLSDWVNYRSAADLLLRNEADVTELKTRLSGFANGLNKAVGDAVGFVDAVAKEGRAKNSTTSKDKYLFLTSEASDLGGVLARLSSTVQNFYIPSINLPNLSASQSGLMVRLQDTLNRIIGNSAATVGIAAQPLKAQLQALEIRVSEIRGNATSLTASRLALGQLNKSSAPLIDSIEGAKNQSTLVQTLGKAVNFLPILFALIGVYGLWRFFRLQSSDLVAHEEILEETLAEQQESILTLLDEMSALADGDLTVQAEVTDQITGAIADSVNYAVVEMRELVSQINRASVQVADESKRAVDSVQSVSQSNMQQAEEISSTAQLMQRVSTSMREMSDQASSSSEMAAESMQAATQGAEAVRDTISGMEDMREQIQDTSKRIKRLGESSQRIGDIVSLIDDIADQTNILSLNAAIQASMAGEAGRGFAVVADEVQTLAERSTDATRKIGELVTTIQNDTNDAVLSMEKATQQVVSGTKVANSAGGALSKIEDVSKRLSGLIDTISKGSNEQADVVTRMTDQISQVSTSSTDTSKKAQNSANSIAKLLELAKELESSVTRFKLPEENTV